MDPYDIIVIGAGVTGCAVARYLSRFDVKVLVIEKEEDVCSGTSKANSGIVHAGFDALPASMKARMNIRGSRMMKALSEELDFPYENNGALVLCFDRADTGRLRELYDRGVANGVEGLKILSAPEVREKEHNISSGVVAALWAPTSAIVCPFSLTIALAENAASNGVDFVFLQSVSSIEKNGPCFTVRTDRGVYTSKAVVNCAGVYADKIHNMVCGKKLDIVPRRGEYILLDKEVGTLVSSTIFQMPGSFGKGVLVTRTVHGNLLAGPNAQDIQGKEDNETTGEGMEEVKAKVLKSVPDIPFNRMITSFAGLRAHPEGGDFIIGEAEDCEGFFDCAGIESPGLSSAPAIGDYVSELIAQKYGYVEKKNFISTRKGFVSGGGSVVCRCENITEDQIVDAIRRNPGARSMDGIKRRVRQGMGRCQAGFCTPRAMEILSRELGIPMEEVCKNRPGSEMLR